MVIECCRNALKLCPLDSEPYQLLAKIATLEGEFSKARVLWQKAIYLQPEEESLYEALAQNYEQYGELAHALAIRQMAIRIRAEKRQSA